MKNLATVFIVMLITLQGFSQSKENLFWKKIEIKKSFDNKVDKAKPAVASFTLPAGAKDYFTINGGIAYRTSKLGTGITAKKTKLDIFGVYNRNSQLKKEQHNYKAGFTVEREYVFGNTIKPVLNKKGYAKDIPSLWASFSNEYIKDKIDTIGSFGSLFYLAPYISFGNKLKIGKPVTSKSGAVVSYLNLMPGLEYQNKLNVPASDSKGSLTRLFFSALYEWHLQCHEKKSDPNSDWINLFEVSAAYTYRNDFYNSTPKREGYLPLLVFTAAVYPFSNDNISFGATYQKGSDPVNGIDDQEFWQFVFKFKKDIAKK